MKIIKHGRAYIDKTKPFVVKCVCGCEFEITADECYTVSYATFYDFFRGAVIDHMLATCPECEAEINVDDQVKGISK